MKKIKLDANELPDVMLDVTKRKGKAPIIILYEPVINEDNNTICCGETATTYLSNKEYKRYKKGGIFTKMQIAMEAFKTLIELDDMNNSI